MGHSTETAEEHKTVYKNRPAKKTQKEWLQFPSLLHNPAHAFIGTQLLTLGKVVEEISFK